MDFELWPRVILTFAARYDIHMSGCDMLLLPRLNFIRRPFLPLHFLLGKWEQKSYSIPLGTYSLLPQ